MGAELELMRKVVQRWEGVDQTQAPEAFAEAPWLHRAAVVEVGPAAGLPDEAGWVGHDGIDSGWKRFLAPWSDYRISGSNLEQHGNVVLVDVHVEAIGRESRVPVTTDQVQAYVFEDGKVIRIMGFSDRQSALEALSRLAPDATSDPRTPPAR